MVTKNISPNVLVQPSKNNETRNKFTMLSRLIDISACVSTIICQRGILTNF